MADSGAKYGRVTTEHGNIPDDEPVFLLRAQDLHAPAVVNYYRAVAMQTGASREFLDSLDAQVQAMASWQQLHEAKKPD